MSSIKLTCESVPVYKAQPVWSFPYGTLVVSARFLSLTVIESWYPQFATININGQTRLL